MTAEKKQARGRRNEMVTKEEDKEIDINLSPEERAVLEALEEARQNVKSLAKKEMMGEALTGELLNFRLKVCR